jgi:hypothetical protein
MGRIHWLTRVLSIPSRAAQHIRLILASIAQFPRVNPSSAPPSSVGGPAVTVEAGLNTHPDPDLDITQLLRQIRSRYKVLCASLGVRPRLRAAGGAEDAGAGAAGVDEETMHGAGGGAPGSAIPVWKLDSATGAKTPVTNQDLSF